MTTSKINKTPVLSENLFPVVGIGASAGGLEAFKKLIQAIPENSGMAYILVQHLHPEHQSALPEILQRVTHIPVVEISDNVHVDPNYIYVIPSNKLLVATDGILKLSPRSAKGKLNLPIDIFFSSLAEVHQSHAIGVILSGNGADGTIGLKDIKDHGGLTFAQYPGSAPYEGMPQHAINAEVVDFILLPEEIPRKLMELKQSFTILPAGDNPGSKDKTNEDVFIQIIALIALRVGADFSFYKQTTIRRRIIRRMVMLKLENISDYLQNLKKNTVEIDTLFQDLLIPVTSFFRDSSPFDVLCETVFPQILKRPHFAQDEKSLINPLRIWVAGCSTGQEAYSIAICCNEYLRDHFSDIKVQIFATDISAKSIATARIGIYKNRELEGMSETRLQQYFNKTEGNYQIKKSVRDMCVFAVHDFLKDPPFAKMDLISCRNVLIYLEPFLQKKVLVTFHYALNDKGFLLLGKSESRGNSSDLFLSFGKKDKFYIRKSIPGKAVNMMGEHKKIIISDKNYFLQSKERKTDDIQKSADDILLSNYTPAGVVVNDQFDIVQFRGATGEFLEPSPGKASLNVLKMAKEGLAFEIRNALHKAKTTSVRCVREDIVICSGKKLVTIEVIPLLNTIDLHFLVLFRKQVLAESNLELAAGKRKGVGAKNIKDRKDIRIEQLEKDLEHTRADMRSITDDQEIANEELQSSNEELLSGTEELQSLNEELETSKEELQSANEELITVNQELYDSNDELDQSRKFADATISTLHEPLLVIDSNFIIKSANKSFYKTFRLTEDETLGKFLFQLHDNGWDIPGLRKELVKMHKEKAKMNEVEITFTFPIVGERTICFNIQPIERENGEQLILLALNDITIQKSAAQIQEKAFKQLEQNAEMIHNLFMNAPAFVSTLMGPSHIYDLVNPSYQKIFGKRTITGKPIMNALPELKGQGFDKILDKVYNTGKVYVGIEIPIMLTRDEGLLPELRYFNFSYQPIYNEEKEINGILVFGYEITEQLIAKNESEENMKLILESLPQIAVTASAKGKFTFFNKYFLEYAGLSLEDAITRKGWRQILHTEELREVMQACGTSMATGVDFYKEIRLRRKTDGMFHWHLVLGKAIKDRKGKIISWVGSATDIHGQKMKEEKKDEFISIASHEMKTPLTTAKAYLQLLELSLDKKDVDSNLYASKASNSVIRLNDLINELLDVSKIQSGKLNYNITTFNFNDMMENTVEDIKRSSPIHTIITRGKVQREITGDKDRLQQVVINLLNNAIKYSPNAGKIFINIGQGNDEIKVAIKDNGIGISCKNLDRIFDKYYRESGTALKSQGLGIGLFISHEIIHRHQGKLWAESELGKGSTFYFTLPLTPTKLQPFGKAGSRTLFGSVN